MDGSRERNLLGVSYFDLLLGGRCGGLLGGSGQGRVLVNASKPLPQKERGTESKYVRKKENPAPFGEAV